MINAKVLQDSGVWEHPCSAKPMYWPDWSPRMLGAYLKEHAAQLVTSGATGGGTQRFKVNKFVGYALHWCADAHQTE